MLKRNVLIMRLLCTLTIVLAANSGGTVLANSSTTQPSASRMSPKETMLNWADHVSSMTIDDVLSTYAYSGDNQKALAKAFAESVMSAAKLQKAVGNKWGKDAEAVVLHACSADTREDDETAEEKVVGDHATVKFKRDDIMPLLLVRIDGQWKMDMAAYVAAFGPDLTQIEAGARQATAITNSATAAIAAGKYSSADNLAKAIDAQRDKVP